MNEFLKVMEVAFFVLDQIDMLFGVWVLLGFVVAITPMRLFGRLYSSSLHIKY
jgi:hypothetical protein